MMATNERTYRGNLAAARLEMNMTPSEMRHTAETLRSIASDKGLLADATNAASWSVPLMYTVHPNAPTPEHAAEVRARSVALANGKTPVRT